MGKSREAAGSMPEAAVVEAWQQVGFGALAGLAAKAFATGLCDRDAGTDAFPKVVALAAQGAEYGAANSDIIEPILMTLPSPRSRMAPTRC